MVLQTSETHGVLGFYTGLHRMFSFSHDCMFISKFSLPPFPTGTLEVGLVRLDLIVFIYWQIDIRKDIDFI